MKKIAIIGAGQSSLLLGIGLLKYNYDVTVFSERTAEDILSGRITSSQVIFNTALNIEKKYSLNYWDNYCPEINYVSFSLASELGLPRETHWAGKLESPAQSVDQRLKYHAWINNFISKGGTFYAQPVGLKELDEIASEHDLTIVATGKGTLSDLFDIDESRSPFQEPMRALALLYVSGMSPSDKPGVKVNIIPGIGEYFTTPGLTAHGPCEMMLFEGIPGGAFDCWDSVHSNKEALQKATELLQTYVPWEAERCNNLSLTDNKAFLCGRYRPLVRKPTKKLASGQFVIGMGDCLVLNDPIAGQGANNATKCAEIYLQCILGQQEIRFDQRWMLETFEKYWQHAQYAVSWSNMLLTPPTLSTLELLKEAQKHPHIAATIASAFDNPAVLFPWIKQEQTTQNKLSQLKQNTIEDNHLFRTLIRRNAAYCEKFRESSLVSMLHHSSIKDKVKQRNLLDAIQLFSDHFQNTVMLKRAFCERSIYQKIAQQHLEEEFCHNFSLQKRRGFQPAPWDPIIDAVSAWFNWKMITLDEPGKAVVMHLVLEASAEIFFLKINKVMPSYNKDDYFNIHAECDEGHVEIGLSPLKNLSENTYYELFKIQEEAWCIMNTLCERFATLANKNSTPSLLQSEQQLQSC